MVLNTTLEMPVINLPPRRVSFFPKRRDSLPRPRRNLLQVPLLLMLRRRRRSRRRRRLRRKLRLPRSFLMLLLRLKKPSSSTSLDNFPTVNSFTRSLTSPAEMAKVLTLLAPLFATLLRMPSTLSLGREMDLLLPTHPNTTTVMRVMLPPMLMELSRDSSSEELTSLTAPGVAMLRRLPRKCKFLNPPFTKPELTIIGLNPEPPSTTFPTVSGGKFSPKVMHLL